MPLTKDDLRSLIALRAEVLGFISSTTVTVETNLSLDGGATWGGWQAVDASDDLVPGSSGADLRNARVQIRQTLSTTDPARTPSIAASTLETADVIRWSDHYTLDTENPPYPVVLAEIVPRESLVPAAAPSPGLYGELLTQEPEIAPEAEDSALGVRGFGTASFRISNKIKDKALLDGDVLKPFWEGTVPPGNTVKQEMRISLDGGVTWGAWKEVENYGTSRDIPPGHDTSLVRVQLAQVLTTDAVAETPEVTSSKVEHSRLPADLRGRYLRLWRRYSGVNEKLHHGSIRSHSVGSAPRFQSADLLGKAFVDNLPLRTVTTSMFPKAVDVGVAINIAVGRAGVKLGPLPYVEHDDTARIYRYAICEGRGIDGYFKEVFTAYADETALKKVAGVIVSLTRGDLFTLRTNQDLPVNTTLLTETNLSLDGGVTWGGWQTATPGGTIPGSGGVDLGNARLQVRQTLTTTNAAITPSLTTSTVEGSGDVLGIAAGHQQSDDFYKWQYVTIGGEVRHVVGSSESPNTVTTNKRFGSAPVAGVSAYEMKPWRLYDGSQSAPYPEIAVLEFKQPQENNGRFLPVSVDCDALQGERNFPRFIQSILSNRVWGKSLKINKASFDAASALPSITALLCEGAITTESRQILEVISELLSVHGMSLETTDSGLGIVVDTAQATAVANYGLEDGKYENVRTEGLGEVELEEADRLVRNLSLKFRYDHKGGAYLHTFTRAANAAGEDDEVRMSFIYDPQTADRVLDRLRKEHVSRDRTWRLTGRKEAALKKNDRLSVNIPHVTSDKDWRVAGIKPLNQLYELTLVRYLPEVHTYTPGSQVFVEEQRAIPPDYRHTPPSPVSQLGVSWGFEIQNDGTLRALATVSWIPPGENYKESAVFVKKTTDTLYSEVGRGRDYLRVNLTEGLSYDFRVSPLNEFGLPGLAKFVLGQPAPGNPNPPAVPNNNLTPTLTVKLRTFEAEIAVPNAEGDFAGYEWQFTDGSGVNVGNPIKTDSTRVTLTEPGTAALTRKIKVRARNHSGNMSAFTPLSPPKTEELVVTNDIGPNQVTDVVIATLGADATFNTTETDIITTNYTAKGGVLTIKGLGNIKLASSGLGANPTVTMRIKKGSTVLYTLTQVISVPSLTTVITDFFLEDVEIASAGSSATYKLTAQINSTSSLTTIAIQAGSDLVVMEAKR